MPSSDAATCGGTGLDQCSALPAGPFSTHMLFGGEHAPGLVQLLADLYTDALKLEAPCALNDVRVMLNYREWELHWQRRLPGSLAWQDSSLA